MFKYLIKGMKAGIAIQRMDDCRRFGIQLVKIEAAKLYLKSVRGARTSLVGLVLLSLVLGGISLGLLLVHVSVFMLLPWTLHTKALLGLGLGATYAIVGTTLLILCFREKVWIEKSGALALLQDAAGIPEESR